MIRARRISSNGRDPRRECRRHRAAFLDLVGESTAAGLTDSARDHLEQCATCRRTVEDTLLAAHVLRRTWRSPGSAEVPAGAWPGLRDRVTRRTPDARQAGSSILGLAIAGALALALLAPMAVPRATKPPRLQEPGLDPAAIAAAGRQDAASEARWLRATVPTGRIMVFADAGFPAQSSLVRYGETLPELGLLPEARVDSRGRSSDTSP